MDVFLLIETGYEGIEHILGAYQTGEEAAKELLSLRKYRETARPIQRDRAGLEPLKYYPKEYKDPDCRYRPYMPSNPDFWCVLKLSGHQSKCVCREFGVEPSKNMMRG